MTEDLRRLLELLDRTPLGLRDRALLLLGFAGAFRRSEPVALDVDDLEFTSRGVRVQLRRSKTDQEGRGQFVAIPRVPRSPYCPKQAVSDWMVTAAIESGPVFVRLHRGDRVGASRLTDQR